MHATVTDQDVPLTAAKTKYSLGIHCEMDVVLAGCAARRLIRSQCEHCKERATLQRAGQSRRH